MIILCSFSGASSQVSAFSSLLSDILSSLKLLSGEFESVFSNAFFLLCSSSYSYAVDYFFGANKGRHKLWRGGGGGGGGTPLYLLYGDVSLDRVWFSGIPVLNRVYNSRVCVLNRVFVPWTSGRVLLSRVAWARARQNIRHVSEHGVVFKALYCLEQGPKSKWIFLNRVSHFPDYSLNPFTPESDQCQNSPAASQEIWHHTVWRTWLFIAYSDEKWLYYITHTIAFWKVGRIHFLSSGVKGLTGSGFHTASGTLPLNNLNSAPSHAAWK